MNDELRWNKLFGAVLATGLVIMLLTTGAQALFDPGKPPAKPGDAIAIKEEATGGAAEAADTPPDWGTALKTADVAAGQTVSTKCQSCHNIANGGPNMTGPNLWGVIGRAPGVHPGFAYSSGMSDFGKKQPKWDYDHIYAFLAGPQAYINGTKMSFVGLKKPEDRVNLIAWLRQQSSSPEAIPAPDPKKAAAAAAPGGPAPAPGTDVPAKVAGATTPTAAGPGAPASAADAAKVPAAGGPSGPAATTSQAGEGATGTKTLTGKG